ncbi:hypothetical protein GALL_400320 [mine drainage metagenome]|uniref:Uncharacterized protein n=1 Tax=mine drainage metagenome TaxID=410659 RepID=A0A1J5QQM3_9ZZZZ
MAPHLCQRGAQLVVGDGGEVGERVAAQQRAQVVAVGGEQAEVELALHRQPGAVATRAERAGDAGNHADFAGTVVIGPALRRLARAVGLQRMQWKFGVYAVDHLLGRQHLVHTPAVGVAHIHVFDETQDDAAIAEMRRHREDLRVVGAALDHHVHFHWAQSRSLRRLDAPQHFGNGEIHVVHTAEGRIVQCVQAHRHAVEPGVLEQLRLAGEDGAVGGEGEFRWISLWSAQGMQHLDQALQVLAQQGLAAGQADFAHAEIDEHPRRTGDFLETQQIGMPQEFIVLVEDFLRHAVSATEVAPVGDRNAQVVQRAQQAIRGHALRKKHVLRDRGHAGGVAVVDDGNDAIRHGLALSAMRRRHVGRSAGRQGICRGSGVQMPACNASEKVARRMPSTAPTITSDR